MAPSLARLAQPVITAVVAASLVAGGWAAHERADGGQVAEVAVTGVSTQATTAFSCGPVVNSFVRTGNVDVVVRSADPSGFRTLTPATVAFVIPAGQTRCIKVLFTAEHHCYGGTSSNRCVVRALDNGVEMHPQGGGYQHIEWSDGGTRSVAYEWIVRVGAGTHTMSLQYGKIPTTQSTSNSVLVLDEWTFDVTVLS